MTSETIIFRARKILTMDRSNPTATHVAVREGRILAVGGEAEATAWGKARVDDTFKDLVLLPGFVEGHSHAWTGTIWDQPYIGYFDCTDPDGKRWSGCKSIEDILGRLAEAEARMADAATPLTAWGLDPIYFGTARVGIAELDRISTRRPIMLRHSNGHVMSLNSPAMAKAGFVRGMNNQGLMRDDKGGLTGEIKGPALQFAAMKALGLAYEDQLAAPHVLPVFAKTAVRVGATTVTDLINSMPPHVTEQYVKVTSDPRFPLRVKVAMSGLVYSAADGIARLGELARFANDRLHFGLVKLVADGSIQGLSARLKWPGYISGVPNGLWYLAPEQLAEMLHAYHAAGYQVHTHANGDEAIEVVIEAIEAALARTPKTDHRHTIQHCQMVDAAQLRRMRASAITANIFANHIFYWGEQHARHTMGPDKARRIDPVGSALAAGVATTIHSDAPVTPLDPLFTAWCAVNRITSEGRVLGPEERITVAEALRLITIEAAASIKLDHLAGSIEVGKWADFAVLGDDPLSVAPDRLKDVPVWGTVTSGQINRAPAPPA